MFSYYWAKILKKLRGKAIKNSRINRDASIGAGSTVVNTEMGKYSYCGYDCLLVNVSIGAFCSISDNVVVGGGNHPLNWVSTSSAFHKSAGCISKRLARCDYDGSDAHTTIGSDVWIGNGVHIKPGVKIGDGAVIGMGSVVTKDVEPYAIVAGNPAKIIRKRFDEETILKLLNTKWWTWEDERIYAVSDKFDDVSLFLGTEE